VPTVQDFLNILQHITPEELAEDWDNVGLLVGNPQRAVSRILLALDPSCSLIDLACSGGYDLVITHHPIIFRPLKSLRTDTPTGRFIARATGADISVIACHTNFDSIEGGVSDILATSLGLAMTRPLVPSRRGCDPTCGLGRIGMYPLAVPVATFLARLHQACAPPWILEAGQRPRQVVTVAVCGGSCSDLAETALHQGADVFVTAEVKHSVARWAEDAGLWILDAGHFATENPAMDIFKNRLQQQAVDLGWEIEIDTAGQHAPLRLV
jgi:dinuclear metal center YbgI/SA1388 family protein